MGGQSTMGRELLGDLLRKRQIEAAFDVDRCQFRKLGGRLGLDFPAFAGEVGSFGVGLGTDRDLLTRRHRHRPGDQPGYTRDQDAMAGCVGRRHPQDEARRRYDAVIRTHDGRAQPADAFCSMSLAMWHRGLTICTGDGVLLRRRTTSITGPTVTTRHLKLARPPAPVYAIVL
jgi:hypothetical protein